MKDRVQIAQYIENGKNYEAIKMIEDGFDVNKIDEEQEKIISFFTEGGFIAETPLYTACRVFNYEMINYLLNHDANPNISNLNLQYPFEIFLEKHYSKAEDIVENFIKHGVDLELGKRETPMNALMMHYFKASNDKRTIIQREMQVLIDAGISWFNNTQNVKYGNYSILHHVAATNDVIYMKRLLTYKQASKCINKKNNFGKTPLMYAAINNQREMFNLLIESGADETIKDKDGKIAKELFFKGV